MTPIATPAGAETAGAVASGQRQTPSSRRKVLLISLGGGLSLLIAILVVALAFNWGRSDRSETEGQKEGKREPVTLQIARSPMGITALAYSPDGKLLACGSSDQSRPFEPRGEIRIWEIAANREVAVFTVNSDAVSFLSFADNGQVLVSSGAAPTITLWDLQARKERTRLQVASRPRWALSRDGKVLYSPGVFDRKLRAWKVPGGEELAPFLLDHSVHLVALSPNWPTSAFTATDGTSREIHLWDLEKNKRIASLEGHSVKADRLQFSADGKFVASATGYGEGKVTVWDVAEAREACSHRYASGSSGFVLSPDGRLLVVSDRVQFAPKVDPKVFENAIDIREATTGRSLLVLRKHRFQAAAFSPDGKTLATAPGGGIVNLWDVRSLLDGEYAPGQRGDLGRPGG